jgi:hypothetical protein
MAGPVAGPCTGWVSAEEVASCCSVEVGSDFDLFEQAAATASQILYELSARQFPGLCERTVRPCEKRSCGFQVLSRGHVIDWNGCWAGDCWQPALCDCQPVSQVVLPNYPVREIVEVKIDGVVLAPSEYRLDRWNVLTRLASSDGTRQLWPSCQRLDLADDEVGTFSIRYLHGANPPQAGVSAAAQLACEIYKACPGNQGVGGECLLPSGTVRVTRQGVTIERARFLSWAFSRERGWVTGLPLVDLFLGTYNPLGKRRRPAIWSPDHRLPEPIEASGS